MRIISGRFGGRRISMPGSGGVRPTTEKVKESLFNYLQNFLDFEGMKVCDIYAGSGSLGLEALSRGAAEVHFVENNFTVFRNLKSTIEAFGADEECRVFKMSAIKFASLSEHESYDLIIADPPFFRNDIHKAAELIRKNNFVNETGLFLIERSIQTEKKDVEAFGTEPFKRIGDSLIYEL